MIAFGGLGASEGVMMRRRLGWLSISTLALVSGLAAVVLLVASGASGAGAGSFRVRAGAQTFTVNVGISGVTNLGAFEFTLTYNPSVVSPTAAALGLRSSVGWFDSSTVY